MLEDQDQQKRIKGLSALDNDEVYNKLKKSVQERDLQKTIVLKKKEELKDEKSKGPTIDDYFKKVNYERKSNIAPSAEIQNKQFKIIVYEPTTE